MEDVANNTETTKKLGGITGKGFMPGVSGNPSGRPKGTLKDYVRQMFMEMSDKEKREWLTTHKVPAELQWRMGEGNPTSELTGKDGKDLIPTPNERVVALAEKLNEDTRD